MTIVAQRREKAALNEVRNAPIEGSSQIIGVNESNYTSSEQYSETKKRKPEKYEQHVEGLPAAKRSRAQQLEKPKRDREFATIVVSNLSLDVKEGELKTIFHECGKIREIRFLEDKSTQKTAYIEFNEKESVPAALTKDKKKIRDREINVYNISECILYITNFPSSTNIKELFDKYGEIISVRMPNPKYKRVFCYVEFKERDSAQAALEMDGHELEPGKKIKVMISNPPFKKERSPPIQKEIYIRNLPSDVDRNELESLFQTYGPVISVRVPMKHDKCQGIAFVEFENEEHAKASLALNSTEFKGCVLNISLSEINRNRTKKERFNESDKKNLKRKQEESRESEKRSKTVIFTKLPKDITEKNIAEMLSYIFESEAIDKITLISHDKCAHVEFKRVEDAGKAVLHFNKYKLDDAVITAVIGDNLLNESGVKRDGKPAMVPRKLMASSSIKRKSQLGSKLNKKKESAEYQDVEMGDKNISKKSNEDFRKYYL